MTKLAPWIGKNAWHFKRWLTIFRLIAFCGQALAEPLCRSAYFKAKREHQAPRDPWACRNVLHAPEQLDCLVKVRVLPEQPILLFCAPRQIK